MLEIFQKLNYYIKLAIKKPYLIKKLLYNKHLGVIVKIPLVNKEESALKNNIIIEKSQDTNKINRFYQTMGRDSINRIVINKWFSQGQKCFLVTNNKKEVIGSMWIFRDKFILKNTSGRTLSKRKEIIFNNESLYGANVIIDENHRGKGINQQLLNYVINYYANKRKYKNIIIITGASNGAYIRTTMKYNGKLIGITEIRNIMGFTKRKEVFIDLKEKTWSSR